MSRINIYTDRVILALGLGQIISASHQVEVLACDGLAASMSPFVVEHSSPDAAILDAAPGVVSLIQRLRPEGRMVPIAVWERVEAIEPALNALFVGVRGVLLDTSSPGDVLACVETILSGGSWVPPQIAQAAILTRQCKLTKREGELVNLIGFGLSNKEIAFRLGISVGTVKVYLSRLFDKLGVSDRFELALLSLRQAGTGRAAPDATAPERQPIPSGRQEEFCPRSVFVPRRAGEWRDIMPMR